MRLKVVFPIMACAAMLLTPFFWFNSPPSRSTETQPDASAVVPPATTQSPAVEKGSSGGNRIAPAATPVLAPDAPGHDEWVQATQARLIQLSASDDPAALREILGELTSPEPEIRKTSVAAARQFGSRDAVPYLQEAADHTDDAREKVRILDAIDFLKMPSLTELRQLARSAGSAEN